MRRWQSHKVVEAEVIASWRRRSGQQVVYLVSGEVIEVPSDFFARGYPDVNKDYLVRYADGYLSWSPKKAFEEGYTLYAPREATIEEIEKALASAGEKMTVLPDGTVRGSFADEIEAAQNAIKARKERDGVRWEYKIAPLPLHPNNFNELGDQGWELIGYSGKNQSPAQPGFAPVMGNPIFIFKRRVY